MDILGYETRIDGALPDRVGDLEDYGRSSFAVVLGGEGREEYGDLILHLDVLRELVQWIVTESEFADRRTLSDERKNAMDGWFAPRLHASLRIPRRLASDRRFWTWIALEHASEYVQQRFAEADGTVTRWRYTGSLLRNAISRLWWGAEMARDGSDYSHVAPVFGRTRTAQFALELLYSNYHPAPIAFSRVAEGLDGGSRLTDAEMKLLSVRLNALLSLRSLEGVGTSDGSEGEDYGIPWYSERPSLESLVSRDLPTGPPTAFLEPEALLSLERWFRECAVGFPSE